MIVKNLSNTPFEPIIDCFFSSFENYVVPLPTDRAYYKERWKMDKVDYRLYYGMFDGEQLVGFIINAIDTRSGELIAFNTEQVFFPTTEVKRLQKPFMNTPYSI
jgi:hypothetical protein